MTRLGGVLILLLLQDSTATKHKPIALTTFVEPWQGHRPLRHNYLDPKQYLKLKVYKESTSTP